MKILVFLLFLLRPSSAVTLSTDNEVIAWEVAASLLVARSQHTATLLDTGLVLVAGGEIYNGGKWTSLKSAEVYNPTTGKWNTTGSMTYERSGHTATLLTGSVGNGTVLVAGGQDSSHNPVQTAELYIDGSWIPTGNMSAPRFLPIAIELLDKDILVAGGSGSNTAELYNASTGTWSSTGSLSIDRCDFTATLLLDGTVLVVGGYSEVLGDFLDTAELYDAKRGAWNATASMSEIRRGHTATLLKNGNVLVVGGFDRSEYIRYPHVPPTTSVGTVELYNASTREWEQKGDLLNPRAHHTASILKSNGNVVVVGGTDGWFVYGEVEPVEFYIDSVEMYDLTADKWVFVDSLHVQREYHTATTLPSGTILVVGGENSVGALDSTEFSVVAPNCDELNITIPWELTGELSKVRACHTANLLNNGFVLVVGGCKDGELCQNGDILATAELYDPDTGDWSVISPMSSARHGHSATTLLTGKDVLVAGGRDNSGNCLKSAELYNATSNSWSSANSFVTPRWGHIAVELPNGNVLVAGGACLVSFLINYYDDVDLYNASTNSWTSATPMNTGRIGATVTLLLDGTVLVVGGRNYDILCSVESYDSINGWKVKSGLNTCRFCHTASLLNSGTVLVAGGSPDNWPVNMLSSAELYDTALDIWTYTGELAQGRASHAAAMLDGFVILTGGSYFWVSDYYMDTALESVEIYDEASGCWERMKTGLNTARSDHTATVLSDGNILIAGGNYEGEYDVNYALRSSELTVGIGGIYHCTPNPCENNGTCSSVIGKYTCNCTNGWSGPNCTTAATVTGDPHFVGFNGCKYNFGGMDNKVYAIYSDVDLQVNALLKRMSVKGVDGTWMTKIGIRTTDVTIVFDPSVGLLNMDDLSLTATDEPLSFNTTKIQLSLGEDDDLVHGMTLATSTVRINVDVKRLTPDSTDFFVNIGFVLLCQPSSPHGILGQTAKDMDVNVINCSNPIIGMEDDYVIVDGIAGTQFAFEQFQRDIDSTLTKRLLDSHWAASVDCWELF